MKNESGVTLVSLVITIILIFILASITTYSGIEAYKDMKKENYVAKLKVIQEKVDLITSEYDNWSGKAEGKTIKDYLKACFGIETGVDGETSLVQLIEEKGFATANYYYLTADDVKNKLGISDFSDTDMSFAIDFGNRYIIEKKGIKLDGVEYHTQYDLPGGQKVVSSSSNEITYNISANIKNYGLTAKVVLTGTRTVKDGLEVTVSDYEYKKSTENIWKKVEEKDENNYAFTVTESGSYDVRVKGETSGSGYKEKLVSILLVNPPALATGLTPQKLNGSNWVEASVNDGDWYNYSTDKNLWANAKDGAGNWWVWIPRFAYSVNASGHTVSIKFLKDLSSTTTENKVLATGESVHPAFQKSEDGKYTNGEYSNEISGFWVNKYLISTNGKSVPGVAIKNVTVTNSSMSNASLSNGRLSKTSEHGAVLYLTYSLNKRLVSNSITTTGGSSVNCSSTNNLTGVYDLSSNYGEILAGKVVNTATTNSATMMYYLNTSIPNIKGDAIYDANEQIDKIVNPSPAKTNVNSMGANNYIIFGKISGTTQNMFNCTAGMSAGYRGILITK